MKVFEKFPIIRLESLFLDEIWLSSRYRRMIQCYYKVVPTLMNWKYTVMKRLYIVLVLLCTEAMGFKIYQRGNWKSGKWNALPKFPDAILRELKRQIIENSQRIKSNNRSNFHQIPYTVLREVWLLILREIIVLKLREFCRK